MIIKLLIAGREDNNFAENIRHLLYVFANKKLPDSYLPVEFDPFIIKSIHAGQNIELNIANCIGLEQFPRFLSASFNPNVANIFMLACADNDPQPLIYIREKLYPLILSNNKLAPIILVCIRSEKETHENAPLQTSLRFEAQLLANEIKAEYIECSTRNINEIMSTLSKVIATCIEQKNNISLLPRLSSSPEIKSDNLALVPPGNAGNIPAAQMESAHESESSSESEASENDSTPKMRR